MFGLEGLGEFVFKACVGLEVWSSRELRACEEARGAGVSGAPAYKLGSSSCVSEPYSVGSILGPLISGNSHLVSEVKVWGSECRVSSVRLESSGVEPTICFRELCLFGGSGVWDSSRRRRRVSGCCGQRGWAMGFGSCQPVQYTSEAIALSSSVRLQAYLRNPPTCRLLSSRNSDVVLSL